MTDRRALDDAVARDLGALADRTGRHLPELDRTLAAAQTRQDTQPKEGFLVSIARALKSHPWVTTFACAALVALVLLVVPISYNKTVGHDVALTLSAPGVTSNDLAEVAHQFKTLTGAEGVEVTGKNDGGSTTYTLKASLPLGPGLSVARAFAKGLESRGYTAALTETPRIERASTTMYAYAVERVIEIQSDGKTDAQLQDEIRQKLMDAGLRDVSVQVTTNGDQREVRVNAESTVDGSQNSDPVEMPKLVLTRGGQPVSGGEQKGLTVKITTDKAADGGTTLNAEANDGARTVTASIPHSETMSKAQIAVELENQFRAGGLNVKVTADGDRIGVEEGN